MIRFKRYRVLSYAGNSLINSTDCFTLKGAQKYQRAFENYKFAEFACGDNFDPRFRWEIKYWEHGKFVRRLSGGGPNYFLNRYRNFLGTTNG